MTIGLASDDCVKESAAAKATESKCVWFLCRAFVGECSERKNDRWRLSESERSCEGEYLGKNAREHKWRTSSRFVQ